MLVTGSWTTTLLYLAVAALVLGLVLRGMFAALCLRRSEKSGDYMVAEREKSECQSSVVAIILRNFANHPKETLSEYGDHKSARSIILIVTG